MRLLRSLLALAARRRRSSRLGIAVLLVSLAALFAMSGTLRPVLAQSGSRDTARAETIRDGDRDLTAGARLIAFRMRDQFGREHMAADFAGRSLVIIGCDRVGSRYGARWATAFRHAGGADRSGAVTISVATLRGVLRLLRRTVMAHFPADTVQWSLLDWDGEFARTYTFAADACTVVGFDARGGLRHRAVVRDLDAWIVRETLARLTADVGESRP